MKGLLIHFDVIDGKQAEFEATTRVLVQRFESYATQLAHQTQPYVVETMPAMQACMAGPPDVQFLDIVE
jgi:quinol monooxygenase YgiN